MVNVTIGVNLGKIFGDTSAECDKFLLGVKSMGFGDGSPQKLKYFNVYNTLFSP